MAPPKKTGNTGKRICLTYETKAEIIAEVDKGTKAKKDIAKEYGIQPNTLSTFLKDRQKIIGGIVKGKQKCKRQKPCTLPELDGAMKIWFDQTRSADVTVDGSIMRAKGEVLASELGHTGYSMSNGWYGRWKKRYNIKTLKVTGEAASAKDDH